MYCDATVRKEQNITFFTFYFYHIIIVTRKYTLAYTLFARRRFPFSRRKPRQNLYNLNLQYQLCVYTYKIFTNGKYYKKNNMSIL